MDHEKVREIADDLEKTLRHISTSQLPYYLRELVGAKEFLIRRFSPFKVGDRVELSYTPKIDPQNSWGWMGSKHFLLEGAQAVVEKVDCGSSGFSYAVIFDDESWIDHTGNVHARPEDEKHRFHFNETGLRKSDPAIQGHA